MHTERPGNAPDGSSYVALRDYFTLWLERLEMFYTRRFEDLDAKTTLALAAADKAVTKAEIATEKRFEGVNEFRHTLADQAARLMPREEAQSKLENITKEISTLDRAIQVIRESRSNVTGRDLQRDQSRQDESTRHSWMMPMVVIGGIAILNMIINVYFVLKK